MNGIVGCKLTRGLISTAGVVPACRSLDWVSILTANVADAAAVGSYGSECHSRPLPGWKEAGGRASYSLASGPVIALMCFLGLFGLLLSALIPLPAIVPILLYIGLLIGAQAFVSVPKAHAVAVVLAIIPNVAWWASGQIDNVLNAAGTSAAKVGTDALAKAGVVYDGLKTLGGGTILAGMLLGAIAAFVIDKRYYWAAGYCVAGAVLSVIGLIHGEQVAWAASPRYRAGLPARGVGLRGFLPRQQPAPAELPDDQSAARTTVPPRTESAEVAAEPAR